MCALDELIISMLRASLLNGLSGREYLTFLYSVRVPDLL